jgi:hypothetical protein
VPTTSHLVKINAYKKVFVPTSLEQKNLLDKLYSYTFLDRFATYPCKKFFLVFFEQIVLLTYSLRQISKHLKQIFPPSCLLQESTGPHRQTLKLYTNMSTVAFKRGFRQCKDILPDFWSDHLTTGLGKASKVLKNLSGLPTVPFKTVGSGMSWNCLLFICLLFFVSLAFLPIHDHLHENRVRPLLRSDHQGTRKFFLVICEARGIVNALNKIPVNILLK